MKWHGQLGIQSRFSCFRVFRCLGRPELRKIAQRRRDIVVVGLAPLNTGILRRRLLLPGCGEGTGSKERQEEAGGDEKEGK